MRKIFIFFIKTYHTYFSPFLIHSCKFHPTCSVYTIEAIEKYGVLKGFTFGIWRILKCNPWHSGGCDPVP
ncbi:MAG: membrane protein insertion efficiency factor YidD [bacterium]|nr:membrane protein insertion efficiency factor YidD [bacterium]